MPNSTKKCLAKSEISQIGPDYIEESDLFVKSRRLVSEIGVVEVEGKTPRTQLNSSR